MDARWTESERAKRRRDRRAQHGDWRDRPTRPLSPLERDLLDLLCAGSSAREAAERLGISPGVARNRRHRAYQKLMVHDLRQACVRHASIDDPGDGRPS